MPIPTPWMPLLIERRWLTPNYIGVFSAAVPVVGTLLLMLVTLWTGGRQWWSFELMLGVLLLIPQLILCYFFLQAMKVPSPKGAIWHFMLRGVFAGACYGILVGLFTGSAGLSALGMFFGLFWGFAYTLVYLPILGWVVHLGSVPAHDTPNRLLLTASIWFGALLALLGWLPTGLFRSGFHLWVGLLLVLLAVARDLRLRSVLVRLYKGQLPGMTLVSVDDDPTQHSEGLLPLVSGVGADYNALLFCVDNQEDGPFRSVESKTPVALCPLLPAQGMLLINRRLGVGILCLIFIGLLLWLPSLWR